MRHEDYVTYEQSVKLKKLGFDWSCDYFYTNYLCEGVKINKIASKNNCNEWYNDWVSSMPTLSQAAKWLREHKGIFIGIWNNACGYGWDICDTHGTGIAKFDDNGDDLDSGMFTTYELALSAGIDKVLEILTNNK